MLASVTWSNSVASLRLGTLSTTSVVVGPRLWSLETLLLSGVMSALSLLFSSEDIPSFLLVGYDNLLVVLCLL